MSGARRAGSVVGVGASAGGVEALSRLVANLPSDLPSAVLVVLHISSEGTSVLGRILDRAGSLPAATAEDGEPLEVGRVYVAPVDHHLLVEDGVVRLSRGPRENGHRPAVDPMFRTLADAYGPRATGVVLSGSRDDGTAGLLHVKACGGHALVQDHEEAMFRGMPLSAAANVDVDAVLRVDEIAREITRIAQEQRGDPMADETTASGERGEDDTTATRYTCPDCGGALWREEDGALLRFHCSVGHQYSPESLEDEQRLVVENALWAGVRLLGDRGTYLRELAERAASAGHERSATSFRRRADEADASAAALRRLAERAVSPVHADAADQEVA